MLSKCISRSSINGRRFFSISLARKLNTEGQHMKTELQFPVLSDESNHLYINAFSSMGFTLNSGTKVFGPIAVFPKSILHWNVKNAATITNEALSLFTLLVPKLDIVVIGVGDKGSRISNSAFRYLKSNKINVEVLPTEIACPTFNFLNLERRNVAAALIPPFEDMKITPDKADYRYNTVISGYQDEDLSLDDLRRLSGQTEGSGEKSSLTLQEKFRNYVQSEGEELKRQRAKKSDGGSLDDKTSSSSDDNKKSGSSDDK